MCCGHSCALHKLEATGDIRQVAVAGPRDHPLDRDVPVHGPARKLETLAAGNPPVLRGSFDGVQYERLTMLSGLAAPSGV
ncbi:MAG: hypothetical protein OXN89_17785 [Bryobacterales bacterium]|nr:hypothetical protein [Bryobacterales bacterium]